MTTSSGAVAERYAYTAYGQPTILNASGTVLTNSAFGNRYTYTGREWDETLGLHHFRARWMSPLAGRFLGRDPIKFWAGQYSHYGYVGANSGSHMDPYGLCTEDKIPKFKLNVKASIKKNKDVIVDFKGTKDEMINYKGTDVGKASGLKGSDLAQSKGWLGVTNVEPKFSFSHSTGEMDCESCCPKGGKGKVEYLVALDVNIEIEVTVYYLNWINAGASQSDWDRLQTDVRIHEAQHVADATRIAKSFNGSQEMGPLSIAYCPTDSEELTDKKKKSLADAIAKAQDRLKKDLGEAYNKQFLESMEKFHNTRAGRKIVIGDYIK